MKIFTSYFAMEKKIPDGYEIMSIALRSPYFSNCSEILWLHPTEGMLADYKKTGDVEEYTKQYREEILGRLDVDLFWKEMEEEFGDKTVVLLCWERPDKFCHRHLVAKWFTDAGHPVTELTYEAREEEWK